MNCASAQIDVEKISDAAALRLAFPNSAQFAQALRAVVVRCTAGQP